jgi:DNA mismatch repair protein MutS
MNDAYAGAAWPPPSGPVASGEAAAGGLSVAAEGFESILSPAGSGGGPRLQLLSADAARDLNLDQIIAAITAGHDALDLKPFFSAPLRDPDVIAYRHEVMRDLDNPPVMARIRGFISAFRTIRDTLAQSAKLYHQRQKERVFVDAIDLYVAEIEALARELPELPIRSRGLRDFAAHVAAHAASPAFHRLRQGSARAKELLAAIRYCIGINGDSVTVRAYADEVDYSEIIANTFARFRQDPAKDYRVAFRDDPPMNTVEERILDLLARLYPEAFDFLAAYVTDNHDFVDLLIDRFFREIHFYVLYLEYIAPMRQLGLALCYPAVSVHDKQTFARGTFDLALAAKLAQGGTAVVTNDLFLRGQERIFVVSGPNQGGKTTFVRTVGQLHHLAAVGCLVPGRKARLFLPDCIHTHFEREETVVSLRGKLEDDLIRMHEILAVATPDSIILMNEIFSSTTLADAVFLATRMMERIIALDCLAVCVTFMDELAALDPKIVSMTSTVVPDDPAQRTLKVIRRPADGRAYAYSIAEKYRLTRTWIERRLAR